MKKLFGEYLVEKNVITDEELCNALLKQFVFMTNFITISRKNGFLETREIIYFLNMQCKMRLQVLNFCEISSKKLPDDDLFLEEFKNLKMPLGQILSQEFKIPLEKIVNSLDNYIGDNQSTATPESLLVNDIFSTNFLDFTTHEPKKQELTTGNSPEIITESKENVLLGFEFKEINLDILEEYLEGFNEDKKSELETIVLNWEKVNIAEKSEIKSLDQSMRSFYREYHTLKGTSRFIGGSLTEKIVHCAEDLLSIVMNNIQKMDSILLAKISSVNLRVIDVIWEIKSCLELNRQEKSYFGQDGKEALVKELLLDLCATTKSVRAAVGELNLDEIANEF